MKAKALVPTTQAVAIKEEVATRLSSICSKYKLPKYDTYLFIVAILFCRMDIYKSLCEKYNISDYDSNIMAASLMIALTIKHSIRIGQYHNVRRQ